MNPEQSLKSLIKEKAQALFQIELSAEHIQLQQTKKEFEGDFTLVVFPIAKLAKKSPQEVAQLMGEKISENKEIVSSFNVVQGFLNIVLQNKIWLDQLYTFYADKNFGISSAKKNRVMVEYASPNTNKPVHLGHLRNIFLGDSVANILEASGNNVVRTQIINDRGIHICKSMLAWKLKGNNETPQSSLLKGDKLVGKYYVEFDTMLRAETKALTEEFLIGNFNNVPEEVKNEFLKLQQAKSEKDDEKAIKAIEGKIKELVSNQTPIMRSVKQMLIDWENGNSEVVDLWKKMNGWVYDGFNATYQTMNVSFDKLYYESDTYKLGKEIVEEGIEKGIFYKKEDGSVWVDLTADGMDEKLVLRSDGTSVYITQDIGTAKVRFEDYPDINGIIYTVGNEQDYHFQVLFLILKKLGYKWADNCYHLSYGMVDLPSGKMKSREGTVVDADDLMQDVIDKARQITQERGHIEGMSEDEKEQLYKTIGLGGLKYFLLKVDPKKRMLFNPEESVDLNGNTGPFIQYAYARISSLLRKADKFEIPADLADLHESEKNLIIQLSLYTATIEQASKTYSPALLANYLYDLVKAYNSFYQELSIFKEENESKRNFRLILSSTVGKTLKSGMKLLGIDVPERM